MYRMKRWNPVHEMEMLNRAMNRMMESDSTVDAHIRAWQLAVDIAENDDSYFVKASVPGIHPDNLEITFEDDVLTIKGEHKADETINDDNYRLRERRFGEFSRSVRFPVDIDADKVEATYENGVLTLEVPKSEVVKPKRISVKFNDKVIEAK